MDEIFRRERSLVEEQLLGVNPFCEGDESSEQKSKLDEERKKIAEKALATLNGEFGADKFNEVISYLNCLRRRDIISQFQIDLFRKSGDFRCLEVKKDFDEIEALIANKYLKFRYEDGLFKLFLGENLLKNELILNIGTCEEPILQSYPTNDLFFNLNFDNNVFQIVESLDLTGASWFGSEEVKKLSTLPFYFLKNLNLNQRHIGDEGLEYLLKADFMDFIESLTLNHCHISGFGLAKLCKASLPKLKNLNISCNGLTQNDLLSLLDSQFLENLESLEIAGNSFLEPTFASLISSPKLQNLKQLNLSGMGHTNQSLMQVVNSPSLANLRRLDLIFCPGIDLEVWQALISSQNLPSLRLINLNANYFSQEKKSKLLTLAKLQGRSLIF